MPWHLRTVSIEGMAYCMMLKAFDLPGSRCSSMLGQQVAGSNPGRTNSEKESASIAMVSASHLKAMDRMTHGMVSVLRMRTAISPWQWKPCPLSLSGQISMA